MKLSELHNDLRTYIDALNQESISDNRKTLFAPIVDYVTNTIRRGDRAKLNFICTHNSRRSQFAQVWAQCAADVFALPVDVFSGGTEVTACNPKTIAALQRAGFTIESTGTDNPVYRIRYSQNDHPIIAFSKVHDDDFNPVDGFAAIMTCSDADENCPFIPRAEIRIPLLYIDPKHSDDSSKEEATYDECCKRIAAEMFHIFSLVKSRIGK